MNIIGTAVILVITLLVVPVISYFTGTYPGPSEWAVLKSILSILLAAWVCCFVLGELTGNVSQVDKVWSLLPMVYAWTVTTHGDFSPRLLIMALLVTAWGLRLTYNFSRHGAYRLKFWTGHEDYRWQVLRQKPEFQPGWKWTLFNFGFISGYQNAKKRLIEAGQPLTGNYARGFLDTGLWAWSRHPNYFAEQGTWISFYLFSVAASGQWINWSIGGCILLVILFRGSSNFSEEISAGKYPEYAQYQENVPRFVPIRYR